MNKPVAWMMKAREPSLHSPDYITFETPTRDMKVSHHPYALYTHPVKELHLSLQKSKQTGELLAVTYTDDEHRIVEVLWQKPPVKELTDEEWNKAFDFYCETDEGVLRFDLELRDEWKKEQLIRWKESLRKAQEK